MQQELVHEHAYQDGIVKNAKEYKNAMEGFVPIHCPFYSIYIHNKYNIHTYINTNNGK